MPSRSARDKHEILSAARHVLPQLAAMVAHTSGASIPEQVAKKFWATLEALLDADPLQAAYESPECFMLELEVKQLVGRLPTAPASKRALENRLMEFAISRREWQLSESFIRSAVPTANKHRAALLRAFQKTDQKEVSGG